MGNGCVALHFSPHPDDELIGAPATLMALRDAGYRVVNVACGLGRPAQQGRREGELREACRRAGFELHLPASPVSMSSDRDPDAAHAELTALGSEALAEYDPRVVVAPDPDDLHPGHRLVAAAVREAIDRSSLAPRLWTWALWGSLARPTLGTQFGGDRLDEILAALSAHEGELARNDYRRLVRGRAEMSASLAAELLFGFGTAVVTDAPYAELLSEHTRTGGGWRRAAPRWLDPAAPLG